GCRGVSRGALEVDAVGAPARAPVDAPDVVAGHVRAVLGEVRRAAQVGRAVQPAHEALHHRTREQLQVADPRHHLGGKEGAGGDVAPGLGAAHGEPSYIPDRGRGTAARSSSTMRALPMRSDSAWKLVRMRWRNTGWAGARTASRLTW